MADIAIKKTCENCAYGYSNPGYAPCNSCDHNLSKWEAGNGIIQELPVKENENKYTYFVFYRWYDGKGHFGVGNYGIVTDEKIKTMADVRFIETYIKGEFGYERVIVENWKELEGSGE